MNTDFQDANFFITAMRAYKLNFLMALAIAAGLLLVEWLTPVFNSKFFGILFEALLTASFAYAIHYTVLFGKNAGWATTFNDKSSTRFVWRSMIFLGFIFIVTLILSLAALSLSLVPEVAIFLILILILVVGVPLIGIFFALFGTMLPATVAGGDASFKASWARAKGNFWYTMLRLALGPFFLGVLLMVLVGLAANAGLPNAIYNSAGNISFVGTVVVMLINMCSLFLTALTAAILCKTYLRSQSITPAP